MAKINTSVVYVPGDRIQITEFVRNYLTEQRLPMPDEGKERVLVPNFRYGSQFDAKGGQEILVCTGVWLGFDFEDELTAEMRDHLSLDGLLVGMPLELEDDELLTIDYLDGRFSLVGIDENKLFAAAMESPNDRKRNRPPVS